jgi:hypothetical protein
MLNAMTLYLDYGKSQMEDILELEATKQTSKNLEID